MLKVGKRKQAVSNNDNEPLKILKVQEVYSDDEHIDDKSDDEEKDLEAFLFGNTDQVTFVQEKTGQIVEKKTEENILSFEISTKPSTDIENDDYTINLNVDEATQSNTAVVKPAWVDDDDQDLDIDIVNNTRLRKLKTDLSETTISGDAYQNRLKRQYEKVLPPPAWADMEKLNQLSKDYSDEEDNIFNAAKKVSSKSKSLRKGIIDIRRLGDLNYSHPCNSTVTSLEFHPHAYIAFTTSLDKKLCIFQADGKENRKLHSLHLQNFPIYTGRFSNDGDRIYMSSRRKFIYSYDLTSGKVVKIPKFRGCREENSFEKFIISPDGNYLAFPASSGYVHLVSAKDFHLVASFKINGKALSVSFAPDSSRLYTAGSDGEIYVWNISSQRCEHRFIDDGSLKTFSLATSPDSNYIAAGSSSGVVNIYDSSCLSSKYPKPIKNVMNLTTSIDHIAFNKTSELLCISSPQKRNALRLIHTSSLTTFSNWPKEKQTLGNVSCFAFSPTSELLGIGNEVGKALLFKLNHYSGS